MKGPLFRDIFLTFISVLMPNAATRWARRAQNHPTVLQFYSCFLQNTAQTPLRLLVCLFKVITKLFSQQLSNCVRVRLISEHQNKRKIPLCYPEFPCAGFSRVKLFLWQSRSVWMRCWPVQDLGLLALNVLLLLHVKHW